MRSIFLCGGFFGFVAAATVGWLAGHAPDRILLDGAVGCLAVALMFRWLWNVILSALRETLQSRQAATASAEAAAKPKS